MVKAHLVVAPPGLSQASTLGLARLPGSNGWSLGVIFPQVSVIRVIKIVCCGVNGLT